MYTVTGKNIHRHDTFAFCRSFKSAESRKLAAFYYPLCFPHCIIYIKQSWYHSWVRINMQMRIKKQLICDYRKIQGIFLDTSKNGILQIMEQRKEVCTKLFTLAQESKIFRLQSLCFWKSRKQYIVFDSVFLYIINRNPSIRYSL